MKVFSYGKHFLKVVIVSCFIIFSVATVNSEGESFGRSIPAYAGSLEHLYTKEHTALETSLLYLLEGLEIWGTWLDPANKVGLLPEAEGRFMMSSTPILQTGSAVPSGIGIMGFAQPITTSHDGIPRGFTANEYLYKQSLISHNDSIEDVFQQVSYLDRLNYQYGVEIAGLTAKVYRKPIEVELTLFAMLQKMGAPSEVAEAWVEEYAKLASLPQTIQLAWLIAGNPLAGTYQLHIESVLEPLSLNKLQVSSAENTMWINQDPFWEEIQKQPFMKAFADLLSNANEEIKRSFIVALFLLEPASSITDGTGSDDFTLRSNTFLQSNQESMYPKSSIGPSFFEEEARKAEAEAQPSYYQSLSDESSGDDLKTSSESEHKNIQIIPKEQQVHNILLGGTVYENRPISFPAYGKTKAYSNLFAWSNIEARKDQKFDLYLHEGFEVMNFVLEGTLILRESDTNTEKWTPLPAGGIQFIKTGNGVQHTGRYIKDSRTLQIWFDPDFSRYSKHPAAYQNYQANSFTETSADGIKTMAYVGNGGPIESETQGLSIKKLTLSPSVEQKLELDLSKVYSIYVIDGAVTFDGQQANKDDYIIIQTITSVTIAAAKESQLLIVETPRRPSYSTYVESTP